MTEAITPTILIVGGTTEGRMAVGVCDEAAKGYYYSTKGSAQYIETAHGKRLTGGLDEVTMSHFCRERGVGLIVDAAHPFAENVHRNIGITGTELSLPVVRVERYFPSIDERMRYFDTYDQVMEYMEEQGYEEVLALTGVNTIARLRPFWQKHRCTFRIMNRPESIDTVIRSGIAPEQILYYDDGEPDESIFHRLRPDAIITKESGESGGFVEKTSTALSMGIPVLVMRRPTLPYVPSEVVYGKYGLRKAIERLLPDFFHLKTGYTTGATATAATVAALTALLTGEKMSAATITLPNNEPATLPIDSIHYRDDGTVTAIALKYSGDDPDVTNGIEICSTIRLTETPREVTFVQGEGVGRVTLPGLGLEIGGPAINATPRQMMTREVLRLLHSYEEECGVEVRISVPQGAQIAMKTFNPRLGIEGGISIIGTSGVVKPFSSEAFVNSIRREMQVSKALGIQHLIINSGAKSERYLKALYPDLPPNAFVQYGNFVGEALKIASEEGFPEVTLCMMLGKAVKLAEGSLDTHSKEGVMNREFLQRVALQSGCSVETIERIGKITMARELWMLIPHEEVAFFRKILTLCYNVCAPLIPHGHLQILLMDDAGNII